MLKIIAWIATILGGIGALFSAYLWWALSQPPDLNSSQWSVGFFFVPIAVLLLIIALVVFLVGVAQLRRMSRAPNPLDNELPGKGMNVYQAIIFVLILAAVAYFIVPKVMSLGY